MRCPQLDTTAPSGNEASVSSGGRKAANRRQASVRSASQSTHCPAPTAPKSAAGELCEHGSEPAEQLQQRANLIGGGETQPTDRLDTRSRLTSLSPCIPQPLGAVSAASRSSFAALQERRLACAPQLIAERPTATRRLRDRALAPITRPRSRTLPRHARARNVRHSAWPKGTTTRLQAEHRTRAPMSEAEHDSEADHRYLSQRAQR